MTPRHGEGETRGQGDRETRRHGDGEMGRQAGGESFSAVLSAASPHPRVTASHSLRILLADDHGLFLEGLTNLLRAGRYAVVGAARDGLEALAVGADAAPRMSS